MRHAETPERVENSFPGLRIEPTHDHQHVAARHALHRPAQTRARDAIRFVERIGADQEAYGAVHARGLVINKGITTGSTPLDAK